MTAEEFLKLKQAPFYKGNIVSDSMEPFLKIGSGIVVEVGIENLKRFDLVVFYQNEKLICHYIWKLNKIVKPRMIQTRNLKGDFDLPIRDDLCLGKVVSHKLGFAQRLKLLLLK